MKSFDLIKNYYYYTNWLLNIIYKSNIIFNIDTPDVKYYTPLINLFKFYYHHNIKV